MRPAGAAEAAEVRGGAQICLLHGCSAKSGEGGAYPGERKGTAEAGAAQRVCVDNLRKRVSRRLGAREYYRVPRPALSGSGLGKLDPRDPHHRGSCFGRGLTESAPPRGGTEDQYRLCHRRLAQERGARDRLEMRQSRDGGGVKAAQARPALGSKPHRGVPSSPAQMLRQTSGVAGQQLKANKKHNFGPRSKHTAH